MEVRINKFLSEAGICSRREADRLIAEGHVTINDTIAVQGSKVTQGQSVKVDGKLISKEREHIVLAFYKPVGIVCTATDKQGKNNIVDFIGYHKRIYPVGRLDKDSEGLILMTNDGELTNKILKTANGHEKEYIVRVNRPITDAFLEKMKQGVYLKELDRVTLPCEVRKESKYTFRIILVQGLNRQIRRMCETLHYKVEGLKRIRIMNILLGDLKVGTYRQLSENELTELNRK